MTANALHPGMVNTGLKLDPEEWTEITKLVAIAVTPDSVKLS